ncbi:Protein of unknown function [Gryllus bimaculatus]|nr:Protein of unknown function [Gryllus bimaculatus]
MTRMDNSSGSVKSFDLEKAEQQKVIRQAQPVKSHAVGIICLQSTQRAEFLLCKELCGREASGEPGRGEFGSCDSPRPAASTRRSPPPVQPARHRHRPRGHRRGRRQPPGRHPRHAVRWCGCSRGRRRRRAT